MIHNSNPGVKVDLTEITMEPAAHLTMEEAVDRLKEQGYRILNVNNKDRKIRVEQNG